MVSFLEFLCHICHWVTSNDFWKIWHQLVLFPQIPKRFLPTGLSRISAKKHSVKYFRRKTIFFLPTLISVSFILKLVTDSLFLSRFPWEILPFSAESTLLNSRPILTAASGFPGDSDGEESACNAGDPDLTPGWRSSLGQGNGCPFHCSCLGNSMGSGAWGTIMHGVTELDTTEAT